LYKSDVCSLSISSHKGKIIKREVYSLKDPAHLAFRVLLPKGSFAQGFFCPVDRMHQD
jgi:hypothetical protein